ALDPGTTRGAGTADVGHDRTGCARRAHPVAWQASRTSGRHRLRRRTEACIGALPLRRIAALARFRAVLRGGRLARGRTAAHECEHARRRLLAAGARRTRVAGFTRQHEAGPVHGAGAETALESATAADQPDTSLAFQP